LKKFVQYKKQVALAAVFFMLSVLVFEFVQNCTAPVFSAYTGQVSAPSGMKVSLAADSKQKLGEWRRAENPTNGKNASVECELKCAVSDCLENAKYDGVIVRYTDQQDQSPVYFPVAELPVSTPDDSSRYAVPFLAEYRLSYSQTLERNHILRI